MVLPALPTSGPVKQALVQKLRANSSIASAAVGGIHEGLNASDRIQYPYVVFSLAFAPYEFAWGSAIFVVWQQGRDDFSSLGDFQFGRNFGDLFNAPATNTFLVKFSRWLNF